MTSSGNPWDVFAALKIERGRHAGEIVEYADLSSINISSEAKLWACKGIDGLLNDDPNWNTFGIPHDRHRMKTFCTMFNLKYRSFRDGWWRNYKNERPCHSSTGKPISSDEASMKSLADDLYDRQRAGLPRWTDADIIQRVQQSRIETAHRHGKSLVEISRIVSPSKKSAEKLLNQYGIFSRKPQVCTEARDKATADMRLFFIWVTVFMPVFGNLPPFKKFNADLSMVGVKPQGMGQRVWIARREEWEKDDKLVADFGIEPQMGLWSS